MSDRERLRQDVGELLADLHTIAFAEENSRPQLVVCYDPETKSFTAYGPYDDPESALVAAATMDAEFNQPKNNDGVPVLYGVAPLMPRQS